MVRSKLIRCYYFKRKKLKKQPLSIPSQGIQRDAEIVPIYRRGGFFFFFTWMWTVYEF